MEEGITLVPDLLIRNASETDWKMKGKPLTSLARKNTSTKRSTRSTERNVNQDSRKDTSTHIPPALLQEGMHVALPHLQNKRVAERSLNRNNQEGMRTPIPAGGMCVALPHPENKRFTESHQKLARNILLAIRNRVFRTVGMGAEMGVTVHRRGARAAAKVVKLITTARRLLGVLFISC